MFIPSPNIPIQLLSDTDDIYIKPKPLFEFDMIIERFFMHVQADL